MSTAAFPSWTSSFLTWTFFGRWALDHIPCADFLPGASHLCVCNPDLNNSLLLSCDSFLRFLCISSDPVCQSCVKFLNVIIIFVKIFAYYASKINLQARESVEESRSKQGNTVKSLRRGRKKRQLWMMQPPYNHESGLCSADFMLQCNLDSLATL